ncbi:hypothetical protein MXB_829, partial [Myxobolus squamalis]
MIHELMITTGSFLEEQKENKQPNQFGTNMMAELLNMNHNSFAGFETQDSGPEQFPKISKAI